MRSDQRKEVLVLYLGFFVTLAFALLPSISYYAVGALFLQAFYSLIRYMSASEPVFRSHLFNYMLAIGVSFAVLLVLTIQSQALLGFELTKALAAAFTGTLYKYDAAVPFGFALFIMFAEVMFAIFWPIVLIARGLFNLNTGVPIFASFRAAAAQAGSAKTALVDRPAAGGSQFTRQSGTRGGFLLSAILPDGRVVRHQLQNNSSTLIGRDSTADLRLDDTAVSRRHALIEVRDGVAVIKDLDSENLTKVDGRQVGFNPVEVRPSDMLEIGPVKITVSAL